MDTNVFVSALMSESGASRQVLRQCLTGRHLPLIGEKLYCEYEDLLSRSELFDGCALSAAERYEVFDAFLSQSEFQEVYYLWRPNLTDEGDNHIVELAVAGGVEAVVTHNVKDFRGGELKFPSFELLTPRDFLERTK